MKAFVRKSTVAVFVSMMAAGNLVEYAAGADNPDDADRPRDHRRTDVVRVVEECWDSAVDMTGYSPEKDYFVVGGGAGTIIHEDGYILTVSHVAKDELGGPRNTIHLADGTVYPYTIVQRVHDKELAIVKVEADRLLKSMKLGRNNDLMPGETVVVIGCPNGARHSVCSGTIGGTNRSGNGAFTPGLLQLSAPINQGNSGGPVINLNSELIGVVQSKLMNENSMGYAVPMNMVRALFMERMSLERTRGLWAGMTVEPSHVARVIAVEPGSPAEKAGVLAGDIIRRAGGLRVGDSLHYCLALAGKKEGDVLDLEVERDGRGIPLSITLQRLPGRAPESVDGLVNGLDACVYTGQWSVLPDFDTLEPTVSEPTDRIPGPAWEAAKAPFGMKFTGYIEVPSYGSYTFKLLSDDGSRLWIGDKLVVDNDGLHPPVERQGWIVLEVGLHPITVTFFDGGGGKALSVSYSGPGITMQELPGTSLFRKPAAHEATGEAR